MKGCLAGVRVIDFTDDSGRFATKLLTEMGADVLRVSGEGSPGQPLRDPLANAAGGVLDWWYDGGKRRYVIDFGRPEAAGSNEAGSGVAGPAAVNSDEAGVGATNSAAANSGADESTERDVYAYRQLAQSADVIIETQRPGRLAELGIDFADLVAANPRLVQISITPFGRTGPRSDWVSSDLVSAAMGGFLSLTGTPNRPLNVWGWQTYNYAGYVAATSALSGLLAARRTGKGAHVDMSIHEVICGSIENMMMQYFFDDHLDIPKVAPRQGSLHWLRAYDLTACGEGTVMITPTPDPQRLFEWMIETGCEEVRKWVGVDTVDLLDEIDDVMDAIRRWIKPFDHRKHWWDAQSRHVAFGAVLDIADVCENPQFAYRGFMAEIDVAGSETDGASSGLKIPWRLVRWGDQGNAGVLPPRPPATGDEELEEVLAHWRAIGDAGSSANNARSASSAGSSATPPNTASAADPGDDSTNADPGDDSTNADSTGDSTDDPADRRPLDGVRIADFTWVLAGPSATKMLGDLGADVIRIQNEERSTVVNSPDHPYYFTWNRSKRSATLDMKHPRALEAARRLVEQCDVLIENFSAGVLQSWGLDWETVHSWNPRLVYVTMSGCGHDGPWNHVISYAPTVHAVSGTTYLTNFSDRSDVGPGFSLNDHLAGFAGAVSTIAALVGRDRTGQGQLVDMAQLEVGAYNIAPAMIQQLAGVNKPVPAGNVDGMAGHAPNEVYRCADDNFVAITVTCDQQWSALVEKVCCDSETASNEADPAVLRSAELDNPASRAENKTQIDKVLASWTAGRTALQAAEQLQAVGVPAGPIQASIDLVNDDPQHAFRNYWQPVDHDVFGPRTVDAFAALWNGQRWWPRHLSPAYLGEHNFDVWTEIAGYEFEEVAELIGEGLFS